MCVIVGLFFVGWVIAEHDIDIGRYYKRSMRMPRYAQSLALSLSISLAHTHTQNGIRNV